MDFDDIEISIESDDDTRITMTFVSLSGRKIEMSEFITHLEIYLKDINDAETERVKLGASIQ
jgi:hypothetical protein